MRLLVLAAATALGAGLLSVSVTSAAPANGLVIDQSIAVLDQAVVQEVGHSRWRSWRRGWRERYERFRHRDHDGDRDRDRMRDRR